VGWTALWNAAGSNTPMTLSVNKDKFNCTAGMLMSSNLLPLFQINTTSLGSAIMIAALCSSNIFKTDKAEMILAAIPGYYGTEVKNYQTDIKSTV